LIFALNYSGDEVTCLKLSNSGELIWENQQIEDIEQAKLLEMSLLEDDEILLSYAKEVEYPLNGYYLQKISDDGELLFAEEGLEIKQVNYHTASVQAIINNYAGKIFCFWNESVERESQIDLKMVDYFGNFISEEINIQTKIFGSVFDYQIIGVNNGPIYYWRDNSDSDNQKLVVQKLDEEGNKVFADKGIDLFPNHKPEYNNYDVIFSEADNLIYAILIDENSNAMINVIDQFGNFVGEDLSFEIDSNGTIHPQLSIYNNDIFVTWVSSENDSSIIKMQKISDGEIAWSENKELLASDNFGFDQYLLSDDYLIVNDLLSFPQRNLSVYRFTEEGELHPDWPTSGVTLAHQANISQLSVADSPNGKLISWTNYLDTYEEQINLQIVNSDGSFMWAEPITNLLANYVTNDIIFNNDIYLTTKTDDSIIKLQKYSLAGEIVWEDELVITDNASKFSVISLADNLAIIWQEEIADDKNTIRLQEITPDGTKIYEEHGIAIYNESSYLESPQLVFDGESAYTGIIDYSSMKPTSEGVLASGQLLAQKLSLQTLSSNEETISPNVVLANYPNPFNPTTTISFSLPNAVDNCQLAIYNLRGQKVKTLLNQPLPRGEHSYVWDGSDGQGQPLSSGVYFYQIVGADFQLTRKMLLLK
ncbi:MAG: FlgD immunoglobulin-like domain containing protein, partial [Candidatus Cloacimonadales bacterium]